MVPVIFMARFCFTHGGAGFSDDYGFYIQFLAKFINGNATLREFLETSMHGPHFVAIPLAMRMLALRLGYWSPGLEICVSFVIAILRTIFLYLIFATRLNSKTGRCSVILLSCAVIFAPAQLSLFVYGDTGITMGLDNLGFLFGLWAVLTFPGRWLGVLLACGAAVLSTASWGVGVCWLVLLGTMLAVRFRDIKHYATFIFVAIVAHLPMIIRTMVSHGSADGVVSLLNPIFIVGALGRPMSPDVDRIDVEYIDGIVAGIIGLILACTLIMMEIRESRHRLVPQRILLPCIAIMTYALFCLYEVSVFRGGIGSWYTALSGNFWIGLCVLALSLFDGGATKPERGRTAWSRIIGACSIMILAGLYLRSNMSYDGKTPFLRSRSLSADSCIRHYASSPTFCELLVFMWQPTYEFESFSRFFESTETSVFGGHQTWTLQGDFPLSNVATFEPSATSRIRWAKNGDKQHNDVPWNSPDHLDMIVGPEGKLSWSIDIPRSVTMAHLKTEVLGQGAHISITTDGHTGALPTSAPKKEKWSSIDVPLSQYAGKSLVVEFSNTLEPHTNGQAVFRYPRIEVRKTRNPSRPSETYRGIRSSIPTNTGASKSFPRSTPDDMIVVSSTWLIWSDMYQHVFSVKPEPACLGDYKALEFSVAMPSTISKRMLSVVFHTKRTDGRLEDGQADIALLEDSYLHSYSYDLRLLNLDYASKIESLSILSPYGAGSEAERDVRFNIRDMRLIRKGDNGTLCQN